MTLELLSMLVGAVTSLAFSYFPGIRGWFEKLLPNQKRLVNIGVAVVCAGAVFGLSCANVVNYLTCDLDGGLIALKVLLNFVIANQAAYALTPKS